MTRREFFSVAAGGAAATLPGTREPLTVPLQLLVDDLAKWRAGQVESFRRRLWPEAAGDLRRCGIQFQITTGAGGIWRPPGRQPMVTGLAHGAINLVVTNRIPMEWDRGRILNGATLRYRGYHLCMIALDHAHGNQIPMLSVNTCTHELLHALMLDVFEDRPAGLAGQAREFRIDWYATNLWLFHQGAAIRKSAGRYVELLAKERPCSCSAVE